MFILKFVINNHGKSMTNLLSDEKMKNFMSSDGFPTC